MTIERAGVLNILESVISFYLIVVTALSLLLIVNEVLFEDLLVIKRHFIHQDLLF